MKNSIFKTVSLFSTALLLLTFASCKKDDKTPAPVEQELITTVRLRFTDTADKQTALFYTYKVENGFNNTTPGTIRIDTIRLSAGKTYRVETDLFNDKAVSADRTLEEIFRERDQHLFLYISDPASGPGTVNPIPGTGITDFQNKPFNQEIEMAAAGSGSSKLRVLLIHEPTNKAAQTPEAAGGETDVDVTFPVIVK